MRFIALKAMLERPGFEEEVRVERAVGQTAPNSFEVVTDDGSVLHSRLETKKFPVAAEVKQRLIAVLAARRAGREEADC